MVAVGRVREGGLCLGGTCGWTSVGQAQKGPAGEVRGRPRLPPATPALAPVLGGAPHREPGPEALQ